MTYLSIDSHKVIAYNAAEQRIENPCVPGSNPGSGTIYLAMVLFLIIF